MKEKKEGLQEGEKKGFPGRRRKSVTSQGKKRVSREGKKENGCGIGDTQRPARCHPGRNIDFNRWKRRSRTYVNWIYSLYIIQNTIFIYIGLLLLFLHHLCSELNLRISNWIQILIYTFYI